MQEHQAAPVVYRFRPTRAALLAGLAGIVAVAFGLLAPLSAQAGDHNGNGKGNNDKPWICHPVEGHGESGNGWNVINPDEHSSHIDEKSNNGKHDRKDGRTDKYKSGGKDCEYPKPTHHPKPTYTHHPKPTHTKPTHHPRPTTSTTTETATVTTTVTTPATPATVTSTTTPPEAPATETTPPEPPAEVPATEPPAEAPVAAPVVEAPQQAAVVENVVPQAATDGADLQPSNAGWSSLQLTLVAAGALLLLAAGLLSARRSQKE